MTAAVMSGRCLCGSVTYSPTTPFASVAHCHCESCRRANGAAFVSWGTIARSHFELSTGFEQLRRYESSQGAFRISCMKCGSPLFMEYVGEPDWTYVTLGSLSNPPVPMPDRHYRYEEHPAWFALGDGLPRLRGKSQASV